MTSGKWFRVSVIRACQAIHSKMKDKLLHIKQPITKIGKNLSTFVDFQGNIHHIWDCDVRLESLTRLPVSSGTKQNSGPAASPARSRRLGDSGSVPGELRMLRTLSGQAPTEQRSTDVSDLGAHLRRLLGMTICLWRSRFWLALDPWEKANTLTQDSGRDVAWASHQVLSDRPRHKTGRAHSHLWSDENGPQETKHIRRKESNTKHTGVRSAEIRPGRVATWVLKTMPRPFNGERTVFSTNGIGENWISTYRRVKLNHTCTK